MIHSTLLFLSAGDITVILIVVVFLFGARKIPEFARGLGKGIKEFKDATGDTKPTDNHPENKA